MQKEKKVQQTVMLNSFQHPHLNQPSFKAKEILKKFQDGHGRQGFTLIELLVVVLIIGILAAVAVPQYQKAVYKTRYATLKNFSESIAKAETVYYLANGTYTEDLDQLDIGLSGGELDDSTPPKYIWGDNYCFANKNSDTKETIHCIDNKIGMGYTVVLEYPQTPKKNCYVYGSKKVEDFPLQNQICQSETGLAKRTGASTTFWSDTDYLRWQYQ